MTVRQILKMGDERLLRQAQPVLAFNTPELLAGIVDMKETMIAANGAGLAAAPTHLAAFEAGGMRRRLACGGQ
jgi:peptide deformylase